MPHFTERFLVCQSNINEKVLEKRTVRQKNKKSYKTKNCLCKNNKKNKKLANF